MRWHEDKPGGVHILPKFMREIERRRENGWAFGGGHFKPNRMRGRERASSTKALCVSQFSSSIMILNPKKWIWDNIPLSFWYKWKKEKKKKTQWKKKRKRTRKNFLFFIFFLSSLMFWCQLPAKDDWRMQVQTGRVCLRWVWVGHKKPNRDKQQTDMGLATQLSRSSTDKPEWPLPNSVFLQGFNRRSILNQ